MILVLTAAGVLLAGLITFHRGGEPPTWDSRDTPIPVERGVEIPRIHGDMTLRGLVKRRNGDPISGATVRLTAGFLHNETKTNDLGRFTFTNVPAGSASLVTFAGGFESDLFQSAEVPPREVIITLAPIENLQDVASAPSRDYGSVQISLKTDLPTAGQRPPRLTLVAMPAAPDARETPLVPRLVEWDPSVKPSLQLESLPPGNYEIFVVPAGASPDSRRALGSTNVMIRPRVSSAVSLELKFGRILGNITYKSQGSPPVANARLRIYRKSPVTDGRIPAQFDTLEVELARAISDDLGNFNIGGIPTGDVDVEVLVIGAHPWKGHVTAAPAPLPLSIQIEKK